MIADHVTPASKINGDDVQSFDSCGHKGIDVIVRTFNSDRYLESCLSTARKFLPVNRLLIVDHNSTDMTLEIAKKYGAEIYQEDVGLGFATSKAIEMAGTEYLIFLDSDVTITRKDFLEEAFKLMRKKNTGAVVGSAKGHIFHYGIPLGLTLMRLDLARSILIPANIEGRETFFIQGKLRENRLKVRYVRDSMEHNSVYRRYRYWPEWQGAQIRITAGLNPREVLYSFLVVFLMLSNSKKLRNLLYTPVFQAKLLNGFLNPEKWHHMDRRQVKIRHTPAKGKVAK
jgi:glycosyltransferase involved in cell wall biosynthesis